MPGFDQILKLERFEAKAENVADQPHAARVVFRGRIDTANPSAEIGAFLSDLHEIFSQAVTEVVLDAVDLAYINSSGIKMMADWMVRVKAGTGYTLKFRLNKKLAWQGELLAPLRHLAPERILIEYSPD